MEQSPLDLPNSDLPQYYDLLIVQASWQAHHSENIKLYIIYFIQEQTFSNKLYSLYCCAKLAPFFSIIFIMKVIRNYSSLEYDILTWMI